jgi:hypothetical protein
MKEAVNTARLSLSVLDCIISQKIYNSEFMGSTDVQNVDSHEHGNEYAGSIRDEKCDTSLSDWWRHKKETIPWS